MQHDTHQIRRILHKAHDEILALKGQVTELEARRHEPVAIVGLACRFPPDVSTAARYWQLLVEGRSAVRSRPPSRARLLGDGERDRVKAGYLEDIFGFDPAFFNITAREAEKIDPQQRLFLVSCWEALENSGVAPKALSGKKVGVFAGVSTQDYLAHLFANTTLEERDLYCLTGNVASFIAGRVSFLLGVRGPSLAVDTACSSSLVAVHLAAQSLRNGECEIALAGGVNVILEERWNEVLQHGKMLSPDSACSAFDRRANGYVRGEGCGVVVLKPLRRALAEGDRVWAVLKGSAVGHNGRSGGITVPSEEAQVEVIRDALRAAGVSPSEVGYIESHGTGTPLGDPLEAHALRAVYGDGREAGPPAQIGSVKTNIGHLEAAAGIAGLIKAVLVLKEKVIPPLAGFTEPSPDVDLGAIGIPRVASEWVAKERHAAISSFGASGANCHVILAEHVAVDAPGERGVEPRPEIVTLSAANDRRLQATCEKLLAADDATRDVPFRSFARATRAVWSGERHRMALVARDHADFVARLRERMDRGVAGREGRGKTAFLFTGQGSQYARMGHALHRREPFFRRALDEGLEAAGALGLDLGGALFGEDAERLNRPEYTQPALVAVGVALARSWRHWGVEPDCVLGYSLGELIAACSVDVLSFEDAMRIAVHRGRITQALPGHGGMACVFDRDRVRAHLASRSASRLTIACDLARETIVAGPSQDIDILLAWCGAEGIDAKRLLVSHAFHSDQMEAALEPLREVLATVRWGGATRPLITNRSGGPADPAELATVEHWVRQLRDPIRFADCVDALRSFGVTELVEIGAAPSLTAMVRRNHPDAGFSFYPSLSPKRPDPDALFESLAAYYERGGDVVWGAFDAGDVGSDRAPLPANQLVLEPFLVRAKPVGGAATVHPSAPRHPWLTSHAAAGDGEDVVCGALDAGRLPCLHDFVVDGVAVVNIGVFTEIVLASYEEARRPPRTVTIGDLTIRRAVTLSGDEQVREFRVGFRPRSDGGDDFTLSFRADGAFEDNVTGTIRNGVSDPPPAAPLALVDLPTAMTGTAFYRALFRRRIFLGPGGAWLTRLAYDERRVEGTLRRADVDEREPAYHVHPAVVDACFQALYALIEPRNKSDLFMLSAVGAYTHRPAKSPPARVLAALTEKTGGNVIHARLRLVAEDGTVLLEVEDCCLRRASRKLLTGPDGDAPAPAPVGAPAELTADRLSEHLAAVLGASRDDVDLTRSLLDLGLDSLLAVELKERLERQLGVAVPLQVLLAGESGEALLARCQASTPATPPPLRDAERARVGLADGGEPFGLTDLQQAYLVGRTASFDLGETATFYYHEVDLDGLDVARIEKAWNRLVERHATLRTIFDADGTARVLPSVPAYVVEVRDYTREDVVDRDAALTRLREELKLTAPDCRRWPIFMVSVTRLTASRLRLHVGLDALAIDAWSTSALFEELSTLYRDPTATLPPIAGTFADYIRYLGEISRSPGHARDREYWARRVAMLPAAPSLPVLDADGAARRAVSSAPRSSGRGRSFHHRSFTIETARWESFKRRASGHRLTPSSAICAAYAEVLACFGKDRHFTLNLLRFNRPNLPELAGVLGNFSSTMLLEVDLRAEQPFHAAAQGLQNGLAEAMEHGSVTGVEVLRERNRILHTTSSASMPVVFASTINFNARDRDHKPVAGHLLSLGRDGEDVFSCIRTPQVWLDHQILEDYDGLRLHWDSLDELFPEGFVDAMFEAYEATIARLCDDEAAWSAVLRRSMVPRRMLVARARANATERPIAPRAIHAPVLEQMVASPSRPAILADDRTVTYGELDTLTRALARTLQAPGMEREARVAIVMDKGWEQVVAAVGVCRAGAVYVPIDAALPDERIRFILADSGATRVVTQPAHAARLAAMTGSAPVILAPAAPPPEDAFVDREVDPTRLAYIIYTSGSTGMPKGVAIEHGSALNTIEDVSDRFRVGASDRALFISSLSFDLSVYDIFGLLGRGGAVVVPSAAGARDPRAWLAACERHGVTVWSSVPALVEMLAHHIDGERRALPEPLRLFMMSGDWIPVSLPDKLRSLGSPGAPLEIVSLGGATEASIWSNHHPIVAVPEGARSILYGKPLANQRFHVLDPLLEPCPDHVPGELYIAGRGLARCYWNSPEKTRAGFFAHPRTGERLYRTGDLGRYLPDGNIEFLGRQDSQVKIQGYRIELGEIEAAILGHAGVRQTVAVVGGGSQAGRFVIGYYVVAEDGGVSDGSLREHLARRLPEYMIPKYLVAVPAVPLTANGKVDRASLPDPTLRDAARAPRPPRELTPTEVRLVRLWEELLGQREIGPDDGFFELGGQSFLAIRLVAAIRKTFSVPFDLSTLLRHPTIGELAPLLERPTDDAGCLVELDVSGPERPRLFLVHPVGGSIFCYRDLCGVLRGSFALYGVQARGFYSAGEPWDNVEDMAGDYVRQLLDVQREGPFRIGGWSLGGVIAFEMALQLERLGHEVELVFALDSVVRSDSKALDRVDLLKKFMVDILGGTTPDLDYERIAPLPDEKMMAALRPFFAGNAAFASLHDADLARLFGVYLCGLHALERYRPRSRLRARMVAVEARHGYWTQFAATPWSSLCERLTTEPIDGDHYTIALRDGAIVGETILRAWRAGVSATQGTRPARAAPLRIDAESDARAE